MLKVVNKWAFHQNMLLINCYTMLSSRLNSKFKSEGGFSAFLIVFLNLLNHTICHIFGKITLVTDLLLEIQIHVN